MKHYKASWWSIHLPSGWTGKEDEDCHTFESVRGVGALQISAHRKSDDAVSDDDLREFVGEIPVSAVGFGVLTGFRTRYSDGDAFWIKWWLRSGNMMVYATYNCSAEEGNEEEETLIERTLGTLVES